MPRPKRPSCADFIVEAIRQTRPAISNLKEGTAAGKALHSIYKLAKHFYGERVFRKSLRELIESGAVLLTARVKEKFFAGATGYNSDRVQKILRVPVHALLEQESWFFDAKGKSAEKDVQMHVQVMREIMLYVVADGLPVTIAKAVSSKGNTKAEEIMATLQKK